MRDCKCALWPLALVDLSNLSGLVTDASSGNAWHKHGATIVDLVRGRDATVRR